jgi:hypothetical protein
MAAWLCAILSVAAFTEPQKVRLTGTAVLPSGEPAAGATVLGTCWHSPAVRVQADRDGRFTLESEFAGPANITATSADGKFAGKLWIAPQSIRRRASESLLLKLTPTRVVNVVVKKDGQPAAGVQVNYSEHLPPQRTDGEGKARFSVPADESSVRFCAWDPGRGAGGGSSKDDETSMQSTVAIDLQPTASATFSVIDEFDRPVAGLRLAAFCRLANDEWFMGDQFPESVGTTDAKGESTVSWMPSNRKYVYTEPADAAWENDGAEGLGEPVPGKLHVRRAQRLKGKVIMPEGLSPENLLVSASSDGLRHRGTNSGARVRADGSFELPVVSEHFFTIGVVDEEWTSLRHYGVLFGRNDKPRELTLDAKRATALEVRVVAGKDRKPLARGWIQGGEDVVKEWSDSKGEKRRCHAGLRQVAYADENGVAKFGLGWDEVSFSVSHGQWREEKKAKPPQSGPFEIVFHKPYVDKLRVAGRIDPPPGAPGRVELRWAGGDHWDSPIQTATVAADGRFNVETDQPTLRLFATDKYGKSSAVADVTVATESLVMPMIPNGAYGGTARDSNGDPIPNCDVTLFFYRSKPLFSRTVRTDAKGKFLFEDVPAETKLSVQLKPPGVAVRYREHGLAYVDRGERYLDAVDVCSEMPASKKKPGPSIAKELASRINDAHIWHAPAVIVAAGPGAETAELRTRLDGEDDWSNEIAKYLFPIDVSADRLAYDADGKAEFAKRGWKAPTWGELLVAVVSEEGRSLGNVVLKADEGDSTKKGVAFLKRFAPNDSSAIDAVNAALSEAKHTDRRVIVQLGGLRCGPCYRFARWVEKHKKELEKDFVFVKLSNLHTDWNAVFDKYALKPAPGIPWTAILDADGKALTTSDSPIGNVGFPSSGIGAKHFRKMLDATAKRLTPQEREALVKTLADF